MKNENMKTYGKQTLIKRELQNIRERFNPSRHTLNLCHNSNIEVYTPKLNKFRVGFAGVGVIGCLLTPATNWLMPFVVRWGLK